MAPLRCLALAWFTVAAACSSSPTPNDAGGDDASTVDGGSDAGDAGSDAGDAGAAGSSFATAIPVTKQTGQSVATGSLPTPATSAVYYKLSGQAGELLRIAAPATPDHTAFTPGYIDTVVTLYDAQQNVVAEANDPVDRSSTDAVLYTRLAAAGDYYVRVVDCNAWERKTSCSTTTPTHLDFALYVDDVASAIQSFTPEQAEPNDTYGTGATLAFAASAVVDLAEGQLQTSGDVDTFDVTYATQTVPAGSRAIAFVYAVPSGQYGDGSTDALSTLSFETSSATLIGQMDPTKAKRLFVPISFGTPYAIQTKGAGTPGANPFYYFQHGVVTRPQEQEPNDTNLGAEPLSAESDGVTFYVSGDAPVNDADWFSIAVPSNVTKLDYACYGLQEGSGATIHSKLLLPNQTVVAGTDLTESGTAAAAATDVAIPGAQSSLLLNVVPASQSATVTGTSYDCEVRFH